MFGKARDDHDSSTLDTSALDEFFGDEAAAENSVEISDLRDRVEQVESQINSQFTSLATYAQIAQEQVELARSEAKAATERSEQRLTSLIERERADRISSSTGVVQPGTPGLTDRLDALEQSVALIQRGLDECRQQQKDLAVAITMMFDRLSAPGSAPAPFAPPCVEPVAVELDGPISDLALPG
jgi:chromosome segregation ATPase